MQPLEKLVHAQMLENQVVILLMLSYVIHGADAGKMVDMAKKRISDTKDVLVRMST